MPDTCSRAEGAEGGCAEAEEGEEGDTRGDERESEGKGTTVL
jgi:hypothetical protein